jgi:hypothetical protein
VRREDAYGFLLSRVECFWSVALYYYTSASPIRTECARPLVLRHYQLLVVFTKCITSRRQSPQGTGTAVHEQKATSMSDRRKQNSGSMFEVGPVSIISGLKVGPHTRGATSRPSTLHRLRLLSSRRSPRARVGCRFDSRSNFPFAPSSSCHCKVEAHPDTGG